MNVFILENADCDRLKHYLWDVEKYSNWLLNKCDINAKFIEEISLNSIDTYYFRFTPSLKDSWFAYSNRIVGLFPWHEDMDKKYDLVARMAGAGRKSTFFDDPQIVGLKKVAEIAGLKHSRKDKMLPYTLIADSRYENKCDLLMCYLGKYNELLKNGNL